MPAAQRSPRAAERALRLLPQLEHHPHARAVLGPALAPGGSASHAYLFHGPAGTGKRDVARAVAAILLGGDGADPDAIAARVARNAHPDLVWVTPSGAAEMLVADIEEPVVAAATRTPFEATRRVFVIEAVDTMNDQAANRMLKTLEEPPRFVHMLLLTERPSDVIPTIASRCQLVRFDPLPAARVASALGCEDGARALACARLARGDARLAAELCSAQGAELRAGAEAFVRSALAGDSDSRPWLGLLESARAVAEHAGESVGERLADELELIPGRERKRHEREAGEARRRLERRERTRMLDLALALSESWLRDVLCVCEGAPELVLAVDRAEELREDTEGCDPSALLEAIELVGDTRLSLAVNVSEELALEALAYRLSALLAHA